MPIKAVVTGASRGIGLAAARHLSDLGYEVTGTCRLPDKLEQEHPGIRWLALDLSRSDSIELFLQQVGRVDVLINNAGISRIAPLEVDQAEAVQEIFEVNLFGPLRLTSSLIPAMRQRAQGWIINIGSLAALFPVPFQSAYSASKAALAVYTQVLRHEVRRLGVRVVLLSPNDIRTTIKPGLEEGSAVEYHAGLAAMRRVREQRMARAAEPEIVARKIAAILKKKNPAPAYAVGGGAPLLVFARRFLPDRLVERVVRSTYGL